MIINFCLHFIMHVTYWQFLKKRQELIKVKYKNNDTYRNTLKLSAICKQTISSQGFLSCFYKILILYKIK
jgi:hypothetical protein